MNTVSIEKCSSCGKSVAAYDGVSTGGSEDSKPLCCRCFNEMIAERMGLDFDHPQFEDTILTDCRGFTHEFHFRTRFVPSGLLVEAFELKGGRRGGYEFAALGDFVDDPVDLRRKVLGRIRRALARKDLEAREGREDDEYGRQVSRGQTVRGRITWDDESNGRLPMLVIDGEDVTWDELGRMLMTFEGFQFKLEIRDRCAAV